MVFKPVGVDENGKFPTRVEEALSATIGDQVATAAQPRSFSGDSHSYDATTAVATAMDLCAIGAGPSGAYFAQGNNLRRVRPDGLFHNIGMPTGVTGAAKFIYEWNGSIYGAFIASADSLWKVWKAPAPSLSTDLAVTWTGPVLTASAGANLAGPMFGSTSTALLLAEQGDPTVAAVPEAHIFRTTDGTTWTTALTVNSPMRHFHAVAGDPYNPGTMYATGGDNQNNCLWKSTDHGATWAAIVTSKDWQAVQISFDEDWVYFAPDAVSIAALYVMDRATNTIRVGAIGSPRGLRVARPGHYGTMANTTSASTNMYLVNPGENLRDIFRPADVGSRIYGAGIPDGTTIAARVNGRQITLSAAATATATNIDFYIERNEVPLSVAFQGVVDPATGIYYGVTNNETQTPGLPYLRPVLFCVPYVGGPVVPLNDLWPVFSPSLFIANGYLWYGAHKRKLIGA